MGCDETLMSCVNQDEQSLVCSTEQYERSLSSWDGQADMTSNDAQSIDDQSSRNENLQDLSETVQHNVQNAPECRETTSVGDGRELLNSEIGNFVDRTYKTSYKLPVEDATFKGDRWDKVVPFNVEYTPKLKSKSSKSKLIIKMPVKFVGFTDEKEKKKIKDAYSESVNRVWSGKFKIRLKVNSSAKKTKGKSCDVWFKLSPADVKVFVDDVGSSNVNAYKISYNPDKDPKLRSSTGPDTVEFTGNAYVNRYNHNQNVFAHEFGHQIGLDDEYAIDYNNVTTSKLKDVQAEVNVDSQNLIFDCPLAYVYWASELPQNKLLELFERTEYKRQYTLPKEKQLFNHEGIDYSAEDMIFDFNGKEKKGFVLKIGNDELDRPLENLISPAPVNTVGRDGKTHLVYFYDKLKVVEKPGPRTYDLDKFFTKGAKIYHNFKEYSVGKGSDGGDIFYCLLYDFKVKNGMITGSKMKTSYLDGAYTTHFAMAKKERAIAGKEKTIAEKERASEEYAQKNATMFNKDDITHKRQDFRKNDKNLMNVGNVVKPYYYAPFKKGMVAAIQRDANGNGYSSTPSEKAPNVEEDWKIG